MRFLTLTAVVTLALAPAACGDDGGAVASGGSGSSGSGSGTTMPMPMTTEQQTTNSWTSAGSSTGDATVGPVDSSDSGTTSNDATAGSTGDTGEPEPLYPPCDLEMEPACTKPYLECYEFAAPEFSACTSPCEVDEDCAQPLTGDAPAVCAGQDFDQCVLECAGGQTCPDGMECVSIADGMFNRCLWPAM